MKAKLKLQKTDLARLSTACEISDVEILQLVELGNVLKVEVKANSIQDIFELGKAMTSDIVPKVHAVTKEEKAQSKKA